MQFGNPVVGGVTLVRPAIQSPNYVPGVSGWSINADGSAEFANVLVRGSLVVEDPPAYVRILGPDDGGNARVIAMHSDDPLSSEWSIEARSDFINGDTLEIFNTGGGSGGYVRLRDDAAIGNSVAGTRFLAGLTHLLLDGNTIGDSIDSSSRAFRFAAWNPQVFQGPSLARTINYGASLKLGRLVIATALLTLGANGTAGNPIAVELPYVPAFFNAGLLPICGVAFINDSSAGIIYFGGARTRTGTVADFVLSNVAGVGPVGLAPAFTLAGPDQIGVLFVYEAII